MKKKNKNSFNNDSERIEELKLCLETVLDMITNGTGSVESTLGKSHTLIQDVLERFKEDKKFLTADVVVTTVAGIRMEFLGE
jgi:hypothetical protein